MTINFKSRVNSNMTFLFKKRLSHSLLPWHHVTAHRQFETCRRRCGRHREFPRLLPTYVCVFNVATESLLFPPKKKAKCSQACYFRNTSCVVCAQVSWQRFIQNFCYQSCVRSLPLDDSGAKKRSVPDSLAPEAKRSAIAGKI